LDWKKLRIGEIPYANLYPIFFMLRKEADLSGYEFVGGVPSDLNRKIREGLIDISPSSSIEYLRHRDRYELIRDHSISSKGPVGSILLFSKTPIEALEGLTVLTSSQSETSVALLRIVLKKFYGLDCFFESSHKPLRDALSSDTPYLLIGDEALREAVRKWPGIIYIYDIGNEWFHHTGLPFTFALWIARRDCCSGKRDLYRKFLEDLDRAKTSAMKNLDKIAAVCPLKDILSEEYLLCYWRQMSFDLTNEHRKGLELFSAYAEELGLIGHNELLKKERASSKKKELPD
jgi:chorismate dehydratase